jgi:hypothetical protein
MVSELSVLSRDARHESDVGFGRAGEVEAGRGVVADESRDGVQRPDQDR